MDFPVCREKQLQEIVDAIDCGIHLLLLTGPISSGKTTCVKSIMKSDLLNMQKSYIFCDSHQDATVIYSKITQKLKPDLPNSPKSFRTFFEHVLDVPETIIFIDSFDLLKKSKHDVFNKFYTACKANVLPNLYFVFITRSIPSKVVIDPLNVYFISFPPYTESEIVEIITSFHPNAGEESFDNYLKCIMKASLKITKDLRDIIYISYQMKKKEIAFDDDNFSKEVVQQLGNMKKQVQGRVSNLPILARTLLIGSYIAMKTNNLSDFMRLTRSDKKIKKGTQLNAEHEFVPLERILAITKALIFHHLDAFEFDYAVFIQLENLSHLGLLEIRGDIRYNPKAKCIATQKEIECVAKSLSIDIEMYLQ